MLALVDGNVIVVLSVPASVSEWDAVNVLPSAIVRVALVAGAVIATLLKDVAVATPSVGVVSVGLVDNTTLPVPVEVATPVPPRATLSVPVVPEIMGSPVAVAKDADVNSCALVNFLVMPACTIGISSAGSAATAAGSWEIAMLVMDYLSNYLQKC
jgi:hypothetical protein